MTVGGGGGGGDVNKTHGGLFSPSNAHTPIQEPRPNKVMRLKMHNSYTNTLTYVDSGVRVPEPTHTSRSAGHAQPLHRTLLAL